MDNVMRYQKTFMIFSQDDIGFGTDQDPSGYVKIEVKDGKGKLSASVQNLREDSGKSQYQLFIAKCDKMKAIPVNVGILDLKKSRADLQWDFDPRDVSRTGCSIEEFNIAFVELENKYKPQEELICPLVAFKGDKIKWKDKIQNTFNARKFNSTLNNQEEMLVKKQDVYSKFEGELTSKYSNSEPARIDSLNDISKNTREIYESTADEGQIKDSEQTTDVNSGTIDSNSKGEETQGCRQMGNKPTCNSECYKNPIGLENDENFLLRNDVFSMPSFNNSGVNPCMHCNAHTVKKEPFKEEEVKACFEKYFERYNPFKSNKKTYSWWKVGNPVHLNNILYQCNIKNPLLFNPLVLMAYYKYRHLIVGMYTDAVRDKRYIVCGVPGVHNVDDKPFGFACKWVQIEGTRPQYGAFGYWLVYIDSKTGNLVT